ncbi:sugar transferase [Mesorhizobium sp. ZC-5]|uniref:sugar transferase n=1 Tax=Mesorhizobium sp. ZC-5 TaxID=2986066 RepID=UPI0021E84614|nr:sugar transferase [Mesorhizobium sp. ZC-5]MCV3243682.1 sugar transferase [Mesorhizobium sp. ZC-5]
MTKRAFDFLVSLVAIILLLPVMAIVAIVVRRSSPGPALFVQARVGRHEQPFQCYKFRTMATGAPLAGSHDVSASWITPTGRRLRSTKLDELPQLFNVLRGDMSLVGPRPCLPNQEHVIRARRAKDVFSIRPGITGPAQLAAIDMSTPEALAEADRRYIDTKNFFSDLGILFATVAGKGSGDAARY